MTEQKTTIVGGDVHRTTISGEIASALRQANERIDRIDTDPIMRLAMARVSVRTFASDMIATYPDFTQDLAKEFARTAEMIKGSDVLPAEIKRALTAEEASAKSADSKGETTNAEDRQSVGEAGGRGQADPEGGQPGSPSRKSTRHYGSERVRKEHAVLRVGGA
ncbi:MAG: hypothetical protein AAF557_17690 [Pseudomonadota bacterium]